MRIIAVSTMAAFSSIHPDATVALQRWRAVVRAADWSATEDVLKTFPKAKVINAERVRFEVQGGAFRLVVALDFRRRIAFIKFVGTHAEYDRIDSLTVSLF